MNLPELAHTIYAKQQDYRTLVRAEAQKLKLDDVLSAIQLDPWYFINRDFEEGKTMDFITTQGLFSIRLNNEALIVYHDDFEITRFQGKKVTETYQQFCRQIEAYETAYLDNVPF